jgi:hypothetical protein
MIQRIQSVWLLLAAACIFLTLKFPFYSGTFTADNAYREVNGTTGFLLLLTTCITGGLALAIIFLYKNRTLQLRLCVLGMLLTILLIFLYWRETSGFVADKSTYSLWALLPPIAAVLYFLALRSIGRDEKMVRDSDRLR